MSKVTITGIGGVQQTAIAAAFAAAGWTVAGTGRKDGATNLETGAGLAAAFAGSDVVVFTVPQDHRPGVTTAMAQGVMRAASEAQVGRVVVNLAARANERSDAAVFRTLHGIRDLALSGPVPAVVLEPTVYMDNLLAPWSLPGILAGTLAYPAPEEAAITWMSHRTLAEAVVAAATAPVTGQSLRLGGPQALTGPEMATHLGDHLGLPMAYARIPLDGFAAGLNAAFGPPAGDRIAELYAALEDQPDAMADGAEGMARLGVAPESLAAFAARQTWA